MEVFAEEIRLGNVDILDVTFRCVYVRLSWRWRMRASLYLYSNYNNIMFIIYI